MNKKIYNQPKVNVEAMMSMTIICASIFDGGTSSQQPGETIGE